MFLIPLAETLQVQPYKTNLAKSAQKNDKIERKVIDSKARSV